MNGHSYYSCRAKSLLVIAVFIFISSLTFADSKIVFGGTAVDGNGKIIPGYWIDDSWFSLYMPSKYSAGYVTCITTNESDIYCGGYLVDLNKKSVCVFWKNNSIEYLSVLESNGSYKTDRVNSIAVIYGDVYFSGYTQSQAAYWKNNELILLENLAKDIRYSNSSAKNLVFVNDKVVVGGNNQDETGHSYQGYWINGEWNYLDAPQDSIKNIFGAIIEQDSKLLIVGAYFDSTKDKGIDPTWGMIHPILWIDGKNHELMQPANGKRSWCTGIALLNDDIWVSGVVEDSLELRMAKKPTFNSAGYWKNGQWSFLPKIVENKQSETSGILINDGDVVISGYCMDIKDSKIPGYWKNEVWNKLEMNKNRKALANMHAREVTSMAILYE
jgi:hypothetical protein